MNLALLTPVWIPDLSDLAIMRLADRIILQDTEPFSRKGRMHRARIRTPGGTQWIRIPVAGEDKSGPVNRVRIDQTHNWPADIMRILALNYRNSIYFDFYESEIKADLDEGRHMTFLIDFILYTHKRLYNYLYLDILEEPAGNIPEYHSDPAVLMRNTGADRLFQEHDSRHYQRQYEHKAVPRIRLPEYRQHFKGFVENCCLYDLLFEYGPEAFKILDRIPEEPL